MAFQVWSLGHRGDAAEVAQVRERLMERFSLDAARAERVVLQACRLKQTDVRQEAERYAAALRGIGVPVEVRDSNTNVITGTAATSGSDTASASAAGVAGSGLSAAAIRAALADGIPSSRTSAAFVFSLLFAGLTTLIAPLIYLAVVAALVAALGFYAMQLPELLSGHISLAGRVMLLVAPPVILGLPILFLLRPLFVHYRAPFEFTVKRKHAPLLYTLVDELAASMGLVAPDRIVVNNEANAAAGSASFGALLRGKRTLVIGLPLVTGLNVTQLAGVLAHEFGHFTQRVASITYYLMHTVNGWFYSRAYEEDPLEARIEGWMESDASRWGLVAVTLWLTKHFIRWIRWLFRLLFKLNHRISASMLRQMEYDADSYEAWLTGSDAFAANSLMLNRLMFATEAVHQTNRTGWRDEKLIADVPVAIAERMRAQGRSQIDDIVTRMNSREATPWDSHPPDEKRIAHAQRLGHAGVLQLDFPATELFADFEELCANVTLFEYRQMGIDKPEQFTREAAEVESHQQQREVEEQSVEDYFDGRTYYRLLQLSPSPQQQPRMDWQASIDKLGTLLQVYEQRNDLFFSTQSKLTQLTMADRLLTNDLGYGKLECGFDEGGDGDLATETRETAAAIEQVSWKLDSIDRLFLHRMRFAIDSLPENERTRAEQLLAALNSIRQHCSQPLQDLRQQQYALVGAWNWSQQQSLPDQVLAWLNVCRNSTDATLRGFINGLSNIANPADAERDETFGDAIARRWGKLPPVSTEIDADSLLGSCESLQNEFWYLYLRLLGELCSICLRQESSNGIVSLRISFAPPG